MRPPARVHRRRSLARLARAGWCLLAPLLLAPGLGVAAPVVIDVQTVDGRTLPGAAVMVQPLDAPSHRPEPVHAVMDQVDRAFAPDLLVIPVGSTVSFPNSDSVSHQIYSFSAAKRFQLPLYRGQPYPPVYFDQAGVVMLGCNIHDFMRGYLLVTEAPWYGLTNHHGTWTVELPHGRYQVSIWHPRLNQSETGLERELTVGDAGRAQLTVHLSKPLLPPPPPKPPKSSDYEY